MPNELLNNTNRRPYVVVLKLKYKKNIYDFAIPFRSNISSRVSQELYFSLPPTSGTRTGNKAGLHLAKMFPVDKSYYEKFNIYPDTQHELNQEIISRKKRDLIVKCEAYLKRIENGDLIRYRVDIDKIISDLNL